MLPHDCSKSRGGLPVEATVAVYPTNLEIENMPYLSITLSLLNNSGNYVLPHFGAAQVGWAECAEAHHRLVQVRVPSEATRPDVKQTGRFLNTILVKHIFN